MNTAGAPQVVTTTCTRSCARTARRKRSAGHGVRDLNTMPNGDRADGHRQVGSAYFTRSFTTTRLQSSRRPSLESHSLLAHDKAGGGLHDASSPSSAPCAELRLQHGAGGRLAPADAFFLSYA